MTDEDWEHALGGIHALVWEGDALIAHGSVIQRRLLHGGRALRTGYVEGVAVRADRRRRGHGAAVMEALERVVRGAYDLGALGATDEGAELYTGRGWQQWRGPLYALTPDGVARTEEDDGGVYVLPVAVALDLSGELTCDWRDGDVW
jgi:aminoglycoside 2'-N-acetyltransferase I